MNLVKTVTSDLIAKYGLLGLLPHKDTKSSPIEEAGVSRVEEAASTCPVPLITDAHNPFLFVIPEPELQNYNKLLLPTCNPIPLDKKIRGKPFKKLKGGWSIVLSCWRQS